MQADKEFVDKLKDIDEGLDVKWDSKNERFNIVRYGKSARRIPFVDGKTTIEVFDKAHHIFTVENEDRSFRKLDERVIDQLRESDTRRYDSLGSLIKEIENYEIDYKRSLDRKNSYAVQELTKENFHRISDGMEELRSAR